MIIPRASNKGSPTKVPMKPLEENEEGECASPASKALEGTKG